MFLRWGFRAAPPNFAMPFQAPHSSAISEYWLTFRALKENQLLALANEHPPPTAIAYQGPPPSFINNYHNVHQIGSESLLSYNIPPPNLNMPPPFYRA